MIHLREYYLEINQHIQMITIFNLFFCVCGKCFTDTILDDLTLTLLSTEINIKGNNKTSDNNNSNNNNTNNNNTSNSNDNNNDNNNNNDNSNNNNSNNS